MTVQLRRYQIAAEHIDEYLAWWRGLLPTREQYGFRILWAYVDPVASEFIWAVAHDAEDFAAAETTYMSSPEREQAVGDYQPPITTSHVAILRPVEY
jgi:hypothetical protein